MRAWAGVMTVGLLAGCVTGQVVPFALPLEEPVASTTRTGSWVDRGPAAEALTERVIGTAHPVLVEGVSADARWVAYCQAREDTDGDGSIDVGFDYHGHSMGDRLRPYIDVDGTEMPIDAFVDSTEDGRYVVIVRQGRVELLDVVAGTQTALGASAEDDPNPLGGPRMAAFDPTGERLLYVHGPVTIRARPRRKDPPWSASVIVRTLATGEEHRIRAGYGVIWRAWFSPDGEHVWALVVDRDRNRNRKLQIPWADTTLSPRGCRGPVMSWSSGHLRGDRPRLMVAARDASALRPEPDGIAILGDWVLARRENGSLVARSATETTEVAPASCEAAVVYTNRETGRAAFVCQSEVITDAERRDWMPLYVFEGGETTNVGVRVEPRWHDHFGVDRPVLLAPEERAYDVAAGAWVPSELALYGGYVAATHGDSVVVVPETLDAYLLDRKSDERHELGEVRAMDYGDPRAVPWQVGSRVTLRRLDRRLAVYDLDGPTLVGHLPAPGYGMSPSGEILTPARGDRFSAMGPLKWRAPE